MLDHKFFIKLKNDYHQYAKYRQQIISIADKALVNSKQAIFSLHRDETNKAEKLLQKTEKLFVSLKKYFQKNSLLENEGAYKAALEEYVEAKLFWQALKYEKITPIDGKTKLSFTNYLGGLCDLTGELLRKIVLFATNEEYGRAKKMKELIASIVAELIKFNLTGYLRTKYDEAKRNLKKAEEILYDIRNK